jgi:hypothetical protein
MVRFGLSGWLLVGGVATATLVALPASRGAIVDGDEQRLAEAAVALPRMLESAVDLEMRFVQEDGAESGHVRVVLTPETRPLTILEARSAAEQAFLEALNEPGLGDNLSRITVVVRLMPAHGTEAAERVFLFVSKGGKTWSVLPGD